MRRSLHNLDKAAPRPLSDNKPAETIAYSVYDIQIKSGQCAITAILHCALDANGQARSLCKLTAIAFRGYSPGWAAFVRQ